MPHQSIASGGKNVSSRRSILRRTSLLTGTADVSAMAALPLCRALQPPDTHRNWDCGCPTPTKLYFLVSMVCSFIVVCKPLLHRCHHSPLMIGLLLVLKLRAVVRVRIIGLGLGPRDELAVKLHQRTIFHLRMQRKRGRQMNNLSCKLHATEIKQQAFCYNRVGLCSLLLVRWYNLVKLTSFQK